MQQMEIVLSNPVGAATGSSQQQEKKEEKKEEKALGRFKGVRINQIRRLEEVRIGKLAFSSTPDPLAVVKLYIQHINIGESGINDQTAIKAIR